MFYCTIQLARERGYPINEILKDDLFNNLIFVDKNGLLANTN